MAAERLKKSKGTGFSKVWANRTSPTGGFLSPAHFRKTLFEDD